MQLNYRKKATGLPEWNPNNIVEIEKEELKKLAQNICSDPQCRYPLLALRLLIHFITSMEASGDISVSARQLAKLFDTHYDTLTKCLKYLRQTGVVTIKHS